MIKPKSFSDILKDHKEFLRKVSFEEINNPKRGVDDSSIEKAYEAYLKAKEGK